MQGTKPGLKNQADAENDLGELALSPPSGGVGLPSAPPALQPLTSRESPSTDQPLVSDPVAHRPQEPLSASRGEELKSLGMNLARPTLAKEQLTRLATERAARNIRKLSRSKPLTKTGRLRRIAQPQTVLDRLVSFTATLLKRLERFITGAHRRPAPLPKKQVATPPSLEEELLSRQLAEFREAKKHRVAGKRRPLRGVQALAPRRWFK